MILASRGTLGTPVRTIARLQSPIVAKLASTSMKTWGSPYLNFLFVTMLMDDTGDEDVGHRWGVGGRAPYLREKKVIGL